VGDVDQPRFVQRRAVERVAVLASGGLDSAVLVADLARGAEVFPVYVQAGLHWEVREQRALNAYLAALEGANVRPLTLLDMPVRRLYGEHWSTTGEGVPAADAPDIDVFLPGRNVLLIGVTAVWCALHGINRIAIGSLDDNPFPDATPHFFESYGRLLSESLGHAIEVLAPYRQRHKWEIIGEFPQLPLDLTLTCMAPVDDAASPAGVVHCGACNKCFERRQAFLKAGVEDRTLYSR